MYNDSRVLALYSDLQEGIRMSHCVQVKLATCSLILLPLNPNRKQVQQAIQNFLELVHLHNCDEYVVPAFELNKYRIDNSPHPQEFLAQYLHSFPFLKRLPLPFLKKQPLSIVKYSLHDLVHASGDDVFLLLSGKVVLRHHQLDSPYDAKILQVGKPGCFIFTSEPNQFQVVFSTEAFLLQLSRAQYLEFVKKQGDFDSEVLKILLDSNKAFGILSEETRNRILYEKGHLVSYKKGALIREMNFRSPWNWQACKAYSNY